MMLKSMHFAIFALFMRLKIQFLFVLGIFSSSNAMAQGYLYTACDSFLIDYKAGLTTQGIQIQKHRRVMAQRAYMHCSPKEGSKVIDSAKFNEYLEVENIIKRYAFDTIYSISTRDSSQLITPVTQVKSVWYKVLYGGNFGYMREEDIATRDFQEMGLLLYHDKQKKTLKLKAFSREEKTIACDSLILDNNIAYLKARLIKQLALTHSAGLVVQLEASSTNAASLFQEQKHFVLVSGGRIYPVVHANQEAGKDTFLVQVAFLPIEFKNGNTLLIANGQLDRVIDMESGEIKAIKSSELGLNSVRNIILVRTYQVHYSTFLDPRGQEHYVRREKQIGQTLYRWNGEQLLELN